MNTFRRSIPALVLGLTIALAGVSVAQNANNQRRQESLVLQVLY